MGLFVPPPFALSSATTTTRNAIPNTARVEGMLVYLASDQITYQLLPAPWTGTDGDWTVFSALNPYTIPTFLAFAIAGQGMIVVDGATVTGSVTFTWSTSPSANVAANSISIRDVTASTTLATGLADDGTQTITLPTTVTLHTGDSHVWRISGTDTKGNPFTRDFTVSCVAASDNTYYVRTDGNDANTGTANTSGGAWLTLQHAADTVGVGDTVNVAAGTYAGFQLGYNVLGVPSGASGHLIWFKGAAGATIGSRNNKTFDAIDVEGCSFIKISGFTITNDGTVSRAGIRMSAGGSGNVISGNTITGTGRFGIITGFLTNSTISGNTVSGVLAGGGQNTGHGIYSANAGDSITITGNTVHGCAGDGIHTNGDASQGGTGIQTGLTITKNTLYDNNTLQGGAAINCDGIVNSVITNNLIYSEHSAGIALYKIDASAPSTGNVVANNTILLATDTPKHCLRLANASAGNVVFNNIFWNAGAGVGGIAADSDSVPVSDYNLSIGRWSVDGGSTLLTLAAWQTATSQDAHSLTMASLASVFNSPSTDVYTLLTSGPAINAGAATFGGKSAPADDILGAARPFAGAFDLGAYESQTLSVLVTAVTPLDTATGVDPAGNVTFTFDRDVVSNSITFALVGTSSGTIAGALTYDSPSKTATFNPTSDLQAGDTFTATISAANAVSGGATLVSPYVWSFSTTGTHRLFGSAYTPANGDGNDGTDLTMGLVFGTDATGQSLTKAWFYKVVANTGVHTAKVWSIGGTLLGSATFSGESASGWQSVTFGSPVPLTANTRYVLGIRMPNGRYAFDNTIHTKSNSPLFTGDVLTTNTHPSCFIAGDANPINGQASDNFYGVDVETSG